MKFKRLSQNLALILAGGVVGFVVGEVGLRALGYYGERASPIEHVIPAENDEVLDYRLRPHAELIRNGIP